MPFGKLQILTMRVDWGGCTQREGRGMRAGVVLPVVLHLPPPNPPQSKESKERGEGSC